MRNSFYEIKNVESRFLSGKNIYKIIFLLILNSAFSTLHSFSQTAPGIEWQNTIGGTNEDFGEVVLQTSDGGYVVGGSSGSYITGDKTETCYGGQINYWVVKLDNAGNIQWQNTIAGYGFNQLETLIQTTDGGYLMGGFSDADSLGDKSEDSFGAFDYWVVKLDSIGNIQWENTIKANDEDYLFCVIQTVDGGYLLGGASGSDSLREKTENCIGGLDYWIVKLNASGNKQWQNTIGGTGTDQLLAMQQTTDGGYFLGGYSYSSISGDKTENNISAGYADYWVLKIDSFGNIQWQNTIGGNLNDFLYTAQQTTDGGYIIGGYSFSPVSGDKTENSVNRDMWIVKLDSAGSIIWQNTIGGNGWDFLYSTKETTDGGFILASTSFSDISGDKTENSIGDADYWVVKLNSSGSIIWQNTIGGSLTDYLYTIQQTSDGGYILGGLSSSSISGDKTENCIGSWDYWIIKLFPDTITGISQLPQLPDYPITISPNPLTTQSKLTFKNPNKEKFLFTLYDITGRVTESVSTTNSEIILTKGSKPAGVYLFNLVNEMTGERWRGKIVIGN